MEMLNERFLTFGKDTPNKLLDARRISYVLIKLACFRARVNAAVRHLLVMNK